MVAEPSVHTSESEEMYLITIARALEDGHHGPVPMPTVATALGVSQVAANEMVKKLAARTLVDYIPYKGVTLTEDGAEIAAGVLRRRRLWGVFLSEHLGLSPQEADDAACEFEHVTPPEVEQRLATFLGQPSVGPRGRPIPTGDGATDAAETGRELAVAEVGATVRVARVVGSGTVAAFLHDEGILPGAQISVVGRSDDGTTLLAVDERHLEISGDIAAAVYYSS
jgi:DtxR family Mn-dependent transcriptional regulator